MADKETPQEQLTREFNEKDNGHDCSEKAFRTVLAYLYWQDGAEWDFVEEVWHTDPYWTRDVCMKELADNFNYGGEKNVTPE